MTDTSVIFNILAKDNATGTLSKISGGVKGLLGAFAIGGAITEMRDAIGAASDLNESVSKAQVVFGASDAAVEQFAAHASTALGMSRQQALEASATFGNFFEAMGVGQPKAAQMSTSLLSLAADLASFNNANPEDVLLALRSGLSGEVEPLRKFGVDLSDATLKQEAMRQGMHINNGVLTASQKAQAAYSLILAQTKTAQGDFSRTSGGAANQQRILAAQFEDVKAKLGTGLLPIMQKALGMFNEFLGFASRNASWLGPLAIGIGVIVGVIWLWNAAQAVLNLELWANPIGLIILAIVVLVGIIVLIATKTTWFQQLWHWIWGGIKDAALAIAHWFMNDFVGSFVRAYDWIKDKSTEAWHWITGKWDAVVGFVSGIPQKIRNVASGMWDGIKDAFRGAINWIIGKWNSLHFSIPSFDFMGFHTPGFTLSVPQIPYLAAGGIVPATPGGRLVVAGEGGEDEAVVPLSKLSRGSGATTLRFAGNTDSAFATALMNLIRIGVVQLIDSDGNPVTVP